MEEQNLIPPLHFKFGHYGQRIWKKHIKHVRKRMNVKLDIRIAQIEETHISKPDTTQVERKAGESQQHFVMFKPARLLGSDLRMAQNHNA